MGDKVKIIESNEDTLVLERIFVAKNEHGDFVPRCFYSGIPCELDWKPGPLADGIVACFPLAAELREDWPLSVTIEKETTHGDPVRQLLQNCTANSRAVAAVRKFLTLQEEGELIAGTPL